MSKLKFDPKYQKAFEQVKYLGDTTLPAAL
jgi:hypothetical protein